MANRLTVFCRNVSVGLAIALAAPATAAAAPDPMLSQQWALSDPAAIGAQEAWS
ncbi:MAG: hypothetical protein QOF69_2144, partial [Solirubrobacteraceae bacterium]|nr:hypothetical protein [Solirubrobacteraceae bacterium]